MNDINKENEESIVKKIENGYMPDSLFHAGRLLKVAFSLKEGELVQIEFTCTAEDKGFTRTWNQVAIGTIGYRDYIGFDGGLWSYFFYEVNGEDYELRVCNVDATPITMNKDIVSIARVSLNYDLP